MRESDASFSARRMDADAASTCPLGETKQRDARLGSPSTFHCLPVRVFCFREVAPKAMQLGTLVMGRAHHRRSRRRPWLAGAPSFVHRVLPRSVQAHDLRAPHQTLATVCHEIRLRLTPPRERRRPLAGSTEIEDLMTAGDDSAVDVTDDDRGKLIADHGDHGLVEQRETGASLAHAQERASLTMPPQRREVRV